MTASDDYPVKFWHTMTHGQNNKLRKLQDEWGMSKRGVLRVLLDSLEIRQGCAYVTGAYPDDRRNYERRRFP